MRNSDLSRPTDAELAILRVLWRRGPSTVRQAHEALSQDRETGYTTALKLMQIMTEKGLVERDESERTHVYRARLTDDRGDRRWPYSRDWRRRQDAHSERRAGD